MRIIEESTHLQSLFESSEILLLDSNTSYKEFYAEASSLSKDYLQIKDKNLSLVPENSREYLLKILAAWIAGKSIILHAPGTPPSVVKEYEDSLKDNHLNFLDPIACYIFTSGSTAKPRAIPLSFKNLFTAARNYSLHYNVKEEDYLPITLPLYHVGGLLIFIRTIFNCAKTSLHRPGNLKSSEFKTYPNFLSVVPLQLERIIANSSELEFFKETVFIIGGAKTSLKTLEDISKNNLKASSTYGMTETCAMIMATPVSSNSEVLKSVGAPFRDVEITLSKDQTMTITTPSASPLFENSTIQTSDQVKIENGHYYIIGRIDDIFISGGENINPLEIENTLRENGIEDPYITPIEDKLLGQKSILFYRGEKTPLEVRELARNSLSPHKRPRHFIKVPSCAFSGIKIKKTTLKEVAPFYARIDQATSVFPLVTCGDPRNPWIILIHGFMGDKEDWRKLTKLLENDFFTIAIDVPGHGENKNVDEVSLEKFQMDFTKFSTILSHPFHLLGYSQGGRLALGLVLRGLSVESLILESASLGIVDEDERERRYQSDLKMFKNTNSSEDLRSFLTYWYENPLFGELKNHASFNELLNKLSQHDWKLWQEALKGFSVGIQPDYRLLLSRVKDLRALTICGEKDHKYLAASKEMEAKFKFSFSKIEDCAHNTHFEKTEEFARTLSNFLK